MDIGSVKKNLNRRVLHRDRYGDKAPYILTGCMIRRNKKTNRCYYQAELMDPAHGNCLVYAGLEDIEEAKQ